MLGIDGPNDFLHRPRQLTGRGIDPFDISGGRLTVLEFTASALAEQSDAGKAGAQIVVDVAGDTGALPFDGALAFQALELASLVAAGDPEHTGGHRGSTKAQGASLKPPGLPNMRQHRERQGSARRVPHLVIIAGDDTEGVSAGRQITVGRYARGLRVRPISLQSLQLMPETYFIRRCKTQGRVVDLEALLACRNLHNGLLGSASGPQRGRQLNRLPFGKEFLDHHRRRKGIRGNVFRVDNGQSLNCWKPKASVARFANRWLEPARTLW